LITEEQRDFRKSRFGASDSAAIMGLVKKRPRSLVFMEKTGRCEPEFSEADRERMGLGNLLEAPVAEIWTDKQKVAGTPFCITPSTETLIHPDHDFIIAHPDYFIEGEPFLLEVKLTQWSQGWGLELTDDVPTPILIQCQKQLGLLPDFKGVYIAVMFAGASIKTYFVRRNQNLIDRIFQYDVDFWYDHVWPNIWPTWETADDLRRQFPDSSGEDIAATETVRELCEDYAHARAAVKHYEELKKKAAAPIMDYMKSASCLLDEDGTIATWNKTKKGRTLRVLLEREFEACQEQ